MNQLLLDNQLCFPLYALSRQVTAQYRPLLEKLGITYPQYLILLLLWESETLTVGAIGERLLLDSGTLTPLLKRMAQKGLIERTRNSTDERQVLIRLTESGLALRGQAAGIPAQLRASLNLDDEQATGLHKQLTTLLNQLTQ